MQFVTVIVPCRDECGYIDACLRSLTCEQDYAGPIEFLLADGRSRDGTRAAIERWITRDPRIRLIDNERGVVPTGLNIAIRAARGEVIVRADAHSEYAPDYISQCVTHLQQTGAHNVGGPMRTRGRGYFQNSVCIATHSKFSLGGALSKDLDHEGPVDSVQYGC